MNIRLEIRTDSIPQEISPEYLLEGLMVKLKLQYLGTWCKELTHWKRPWCLARSKAGEGDDRGWDGWMVSPSWWTWVWASPRTWWWTGKLGVLQSMGLQTIGHNWAIELDWTKECTQVFQVALVVKDPPCQCRRCRFSPWVGKIPWRRAQQSTPVFLPGESHGQRSLVGYSPWGCKKWDTSEAT